MWACVSQLFGTSDCVSTDVSSSKGNVSNQPENSFLASQATAQECVFPAVCRLLPDPAPCAPSPGSTSAARASQNADRPCGSPTLCWRPAGTGPCVQCVSHTQFTGELGPCEAGGRSPRSAAAGSLILNRFVSHPCLCGAEAGPGGRFPGSSGGALHASEEPRRHPSLPFPARLLPSRVWGSEYSGVG